MACSSGNSSGITLISNIPNSGFEDDLLVLMNLRKRKRMESNRESARRSRVRKQKHLDELMTRLAQLRATNSEIIARFGVTTQQLLKVEAENAVLRAQIAELSQRLESLTEILNYIHLNNVSGGFEDYNPNS
ncbi:bZIP transcription factor 44-like [Punica granatum]|uniref:BZIP domain-containing protein n=2 Tax=Punica granatum TaxID=22663 RepID=A0A218WQY1_PUNGR|nr:bZIP transcription factor 44-like [Punica granatum]OWM75033.1 hypothetical protein CDL15_Pgr021384 [Punica granatum]PKI49640.1 hypothetical protein CRG98_029977 [Punica granatum]